MKRVILKFKLKLHKLIPITAIILPFNDGYVEEKEKEEDYIFGTDTGVKKEILQPDGQWLDYLPNEEIQRSKYADFMMCVSASLMNIIQMLNKRIYKNDNDQSDRYPAKLSCTSKKGNTKSRVITAVKKLFGCVDEKDWTWDDTYTWNDFYKNIPEEIIKKGKGWLNDYKINYERVYRSPKMIMEALKYSPQWAAGFAWYEKDGLYRSYGRANHYFVIVGYKENEYWLVFDTYAPFVKKLAWDYNFVACDTIFLNKKTDYNIEEINKFKKQKGCDLIMRPENKGEVYEITKDGLKHLDIHEIANEGIIELKDKGKLILISEEIYKKLLK